MMTKKTMMTVTANGSDYIIDDVDLHPHQDDAWALSAAARDFPSEDNDNNGQ